MQEFEGIYLGPKDDAFTAWHTCLDLDVFIYGSLRLEDDTNDR